jgi:hypothetical protein
MSAAAALATVYTALDKGCSLDQHNGVDLLNRRCGISGTKVFFPIVREHQQK